jgi:hypothetical protein
MRHDSILGYYFHECRTSSRQNPLAPIAGGHGSSDHRARCWHRKVAWRVKSGDELVIAVGVTREEHRAKLEYVSEMELVSARCVGDFGAGRSPVG